MAFAFFDTEIIFWWSHSVKEEVEENSLGGST